ncbi:hypothetical protein SERLA73DRAFT_177388 [Serpula lacrymans var. lacrymans S7.3]|uniref:Uncharacterized protein n=1 Tax=Serpula lacrymans var. lacrymans (strain S7.3) TaxID=936435 RepID=F8PNX3_SERL3|nr:hypothetical protein SERLA73DRAFT_177388 [Serpula lacrymans var. lacrymans S7.3]
MTTQIRRGKSQQMVAIDSVSITEHRRPTKTCAISRDLYIHTLRHNDISICSARKKKRNMTIYSHPRRVLYTRSPYSGRGGKLMYLLGPSKGSEEISGSQ